MNSLGSMKRRNGTRRTSTTGNKKDTLAYDFKASRAATARICSRVNKLRLDGLTFNIIERCNKYVCVRMVNLVLRLHRANLDSI